MSTDKMVIIGMFACLALGAIGMTIEHVIDAPHERDVQIACINARGNWNGNHCEMKP